MLPHDESAEAAVLGCALLSPDAAEGITERLESSAFFAPRHRVVFDAIKGVVDRGETVDEVTLKAAGIDSILLLDLRSSAPVSSRWQSYAGIVERCAKHRRLIQSAEGLSAVEYDDAISRMETTVADLTANEGRGRTRSVAEVMKHLDLSETVESFRAEALPDCWMQRGQLVMVGARPSVGKSALAGQVAYELGSRHVRTRIWSYEMNAEQFARRFIQHRTEFGFVQQMQGLAPHEIEYAKAQMSGDWSRFVSLDDSNPSLSSLTRQIHKAAKDGVSVMIVDHLHILVDGSDRQAVTSATRALKLAANDARLKTDADRRPVVILLAQFSRLEKRQDGGFSPPTMQSFKESGSVEADADIAVLLHTYEECETKAQAEKMRGNGFLVDDIPQESKLGFIHIAKNRYGRKHLHPAAFSGDDQRWIVLDQTDDGRRY